jgi:drug/metabolite transporter (DMT)-like permease
MASIPWLQDFRGELAALAAAFIWAIASVVYTGVGRQIAPVMLNLVKGLVAIALMLLTLLLTGNLMPAIGVYPVGLLALSGAIGIGLGDTVYFKALNTLGPRRTLVLESLAPPLAAILAGVWLQEQLTPGAWLGILLTVAGVTWVVAERAPESPHPYPQVMRGLMYGLLAALAQASGAVLSRAALAGTTIDPLWSSLIRLVAGCLVLLIWVAMRSQSWRQLQRLADRRLLMTVAGTAFASTYLAIWLQQTSLKYAPAGIAQSLSATSPLFVIPIAAAMGDKISLRSILGVCVALIGVWLLFTRS